MAEQHGSQDMQVQGQIAALVVALNTLIKELAPTEEARQSIKKAIKQAAGSSHIPSVLRKSADDTIVRLLDGI